MTAEPTRAEQVDALNLRAVKLGTSGCTAVLHHFTGAICALMDRKGPMRKISVLRAYKAAVEFAEKNK